MEINKGIETFDDRMDASRENKNRKPWGKGDSTDGLSLDSEYKVRIEEVPPAEPAKVTPEPAKFTHKLSNGTVLEAASVEELAGKIEKAFQQTPTPPQDFEDKPLYEPLEFKSRELTLAEQADLLNLWKENPQKALAKLQEAMWGQPVEVVAEKLTRAEQRELLRRQEEAAVEWLGETEEYNPTTANGKKLTDYLKEKGKPLTKQNLTVAFRQLVAAGDKGLLRKAEEVPAVDDGLTEPLPPPTVVPSNQGRIETASQPQVDAAKFAGMTLEEQKQFFAGLRRKQA